MSVTPQQFDSLAGTLGYDSTTAIAAAIAAVPVGGKVVLPATSSGYTVSGGFTLRDPITIEGEGFGSRLLGTLPSGIDLFRVVVNAGDNVRCFRFTDFNVAISGGASIFHLDASASGSSIADVTIERIYGLNAHQNTHGIFVNGGCFDLTFKDNQFTTGSAANVGCIWMINAGDTIRINGGIMTGSGYAVFGTQVAGAGNIVIDGGCNMTANGGIYLPSAYKPILRDFEIELTGPSITGTAINLGSCPGAVIGPGQLQLLPTSSGFGEAIYLGSGSNDVSVNEMTVTAPTGIVGMVISANALRTRLGFANTLNSMALSVSDGSPSSGPNKTQHASFT